MTDEVRDGGMNLLGKVDAWDNLIRIKSESVAQELMGMILKEFCDNDLTSSGGLCVEKKVFLKSKNYSKRKEQNPKNRINVGFYFSDFFLWQAFCRLLMNIQIQIVESPIFLNFRSRSIPRSARSIKIFSNRKLLSHLTSFCYDNNNE